MAYAPYFSVNLTNSNVAKTNGSRSATQESQYLREGDKNLGRTPPIENENPLTLDRVNYLLNGNKSTIEQPPNFNKPSIPKLGIKNPHSTPNKLLTLSDLHKKSETVFGDISESEPTIAIHRRPTDSKFREDLAYYAVRNMPLWADMEAKQTGRPAEQIFFEASEKYETYNNINKRDASINFYEIKFTLPNEATHEQKIKIIDDVINKEGLEKFPYIISMHEKFSTLEPTIHNDHVHIMFSTRIKDGINRDKEHFFSNGDSEGRFKRLNRADGPCEKSKLFTSSDRKKNLKRVRGTIADTINKFYSDNKIDKEVFSGTKLELLEYAVKIGDMEMAEIALLEAQTHLGYQKCNNPNNPDTIKIMKLKERMQAIRDKYAEIRYEESLNSPLPIKKSEPIKYTIDELIQQRNLLHTEIKTLKTAFYTEPPTEPFVIDFNKSKLDIIILEDAIRENKRRMTKDPRTSAIKKFFANNELSNDAIKHSYDVEKLNKLLDHIVGIETQIANNKKCSSAQRNNLDRQYRLVGALQIKIAEFTEHHVIPNLDKIANIEQKLINANTKKTSNIEILFTKIHDIQNKLPDPVLQSALETKSRLADERTYLEKINDIFSNRKTILDTNIDQTTTLLEEIKIATLEKSILTQEIANVQTIKSIQNPLTTPVEATEIIKKFIETYDFTTAAESHQIVKKEILNLQALIPIYDSQIAITKQLLISAEDAKLQAKEFFVKNNPTIFTGDAQNAIDIRCRSPRIADQIAEIANTILQKNIPTNNKIKDIKLKIADVNKQMKELKPLAAKLKVQAEHDIKYAQKNKSSQQVYKIPQSKVGCGSSGGGGSNGGGGPSGLNIAKALSNMLPSDPKVVPLLAHTEDGSIDLSFMTAEQRETALAKIKIDQGL